MRNLAEREGSGTGSLNFQKVVFRRSLSRESQRLLRRLMSASPFFLNMDERDAAELLRFCRVKKVPALSHVFSKGDAGDGFYIIVSGSIAVELDGGQKFRLGRGEIFGVMALVLDQPRSVSAWAEEEVILLHAPRFILETGLCNLRAKILENFARQLARNLHRADIAIENPKKTFGPGK